MITKSYVRPKLKNAGVLALVALALVFLAAPNILQAQYRGAEYCIDCHSPEYEDWLTSGHRMILQEGEKAQHRSLPLPEGMQWDEISYVIGGKNTRALYLDEDGFIYAPSSGENQFNVKTGEWTDYHAGETLSYDCASCHTTGYDPSGSMPGLPGITGSFALAGVQCEHCHGPGDDMESGDTDPAFCGTCHRNNADDNVIAAADGFILSEGQYNEFLGGAHSSAECVTCHNPHQSADYGIVQECSDCHRSVASSYAGTPMETYGVECEDCHMTFATLSAQPLGPHKDDTKSHIFYIDTDPAANMFSADGSTVAMTDGKAAVTMDFACQSCHTTAALGELAKFAKDFHDPSKQMENVGLTAGLTGTWWDSSRGGEGWVLEFGWVGTSLNLFAAFYTYDSMGNQVWLTAQNTAIDGLNVTVNIYITSGAKWGDDFMTSDVALVQWGTGTFTFSSCGAATFNMVPSEAMIAMGYTEQTANLTRDLFQSGIECPTFVNSAP